MGEAKKAPHGRCTCGCARMARRPTTGGGRGSSLPPIRERSSLSPDPEAEQELEHFLDSSHKVRHHLAEVKNREEREAQKKRRENMMLLMIAMEQKLSTTSVNYCRDLLENRSSNSKSM